MGAIAIIPARYASERFPGKILASDTGKPLIRHVVEAAAKCGAISRVVIATDDGRIRDAVEAFAGECVMTSPEHQNGTSRLAEAARTLELSPETVVVNIQGDEPEIEASVVSGAVGALEDSGCPMATAAAPIRCREDLESPDVVKVVLDSGGRALYFSRAPIPHPRSPGAPALRHIGIYAYRVSFLQRYAGLSVTPLEQAERLEQLRALEHGHKIAVYVGEAGWAGIDTPEQYAAFVARYRRE